MGCVKRVGERVMTRDFEGQVVKLNTRASILNQFTELGMPQTMADA